MTLQRRLATAFVLTALVSVLLVGVGILAIARSGATDRAEDEVTRALSVVGDLLGSDRRQVRQLEDLVPANRRDLQLEQLSPVLVGDDGSVGLVRRGRGRPDAANGLPTLGLTQTELARLDEGEIVLRSDGGTVFGLRVVPVSDLPDRQGRLALLAQQRVTTVPRQTVSWFLLSSLIVVLGALAAAVWLARRLVRPIKEIQGATAAIAAGELTTRVGAEGEDELAELGRSVNRMAADLERSKALDQQFLLSVSHDLRTPLTAISGYAEALQDGAVEDPGGAGTIIGNHADRLERLVGDLLDLAKLDANRFRLDLRPVDVSVVVGRTVAGLEAAAATDGIAIEQRIDTDRIIQADADRLAQIVGNLVDNAVGFAGDRVLVEVRAENSTGNSTENGADPGAQDHGESADGPVLAITVSDDGPGFDPEDLPFVFDRLYTGSARPRRAENSTGLGLSIVRELAGAMGGTVEARNGSLGGAAIDVRFPAIDTSSSSTTSPDPSDSTVMTEAVTPRPSSHRSGASPEPPPNA